MISPYLQQLIEKTGGPDGPIGLQFVGSDQPDGTNTHQHDPLDEHQYQVAPGMLYKYRGTCDEEGQVQTHGRVLWMISRYCASYCRFCFRGRFVGLPADRPSPSAHHGTADSPEGHSQNSETLKEKPFLDYDDIEQGASFIRNNPEINEVILSGGDPFICPQDYLLQIFTIMSDLQKSDDLSFVRIHSRAPVTNPRSIRPHHFSALTMVDLPHLVLHVNHPAELTTEVKQFIKTVREQTDTLLFSQSVLLKGVNDSVETLSQLFLDLAKLGVRPYYLHYTDPVPWADRFVVPFPEAVALWQSLRKRASGIVGSAKFVVDSPHGVGKVVVPESEWDLDTIAFRDFDGVTHRLDQQTASTFHHQPENRSGHIFLRQRSSDHSQVQ